MRLRDIEEEGRMKVKCEEEKEREWNKECESLGLMLK